MPRFFSFLLAGLAVVALAEPALAARLTVDLGSARGVQSVGALQRWDVDGNARKKVNKDQKIDAPEVDAAAKPAGGGKWVFDDLPQGTYDIVILLEGKRRIEGFHYPPVLEFDPFFPADATAPEEVVEFIADDISKQRHYENKVQPLYMGGDEKAVRVLVQLLRDLPTSYTPGAGTMRHEVWQYDWLYGGWQKNKRTRVFDRILMQVSELRGWTWVWAKDLGGIEVKTAPVEISFTVPPADDRTLQGLYPY